MDKERSKKRERIIRRARKMTRDQLVKGIRRLANAKKETTATTEHTEDQDCIGHIYQGTCELCGVYHGDPCPGCDQRGYHREECIMSMPGETVDL